MKKDWIETVIKEQFEDGQFNVSSFYDEMLTQLYGDYMQLPPEEDRVYHHLYLAYKKDI